MHQPKASVLVIEDNRMTQEVARAYLEELGYHFAGCAMDGKEGVDLAVSVRPDIILLDVFLLTSNGFDVLKELKGLMPEVKVIMLSGSDDVASMQKAAELGAEGYMTKPFKLDDMRRGLNTWLGRDASEA
jgi:DNA-binding response OmpR family regulator